MRSGEIILETDRLFLRRFTRDDFELMVALNSDPAVMRYITGGRPMTCEENEQRYFAVMLDEYEQNSNLGRWALIEKSTGHFIGSIFMRISKMCQPDEAELGYRLHRSAWGKGYASEISRALIHKTFAETNIERIIATTMTVNAASRRVMEKCGMKFVRKFFEKWPDVIEGSELGDVLYAIDRREIERV